MKAEKIRSFFHGTVSVREENGAVRPFRLTEYQLERYRSIPRCPYPLATAGITLQFTTDADRISFTCSAGTIWNGWEKGEPTMDVYLGQSLLGIHPVIAGGALFTVTQELGAHDPGAVITVFLPHNAELVFTAFDFGAHAKAVPEKKRRFLILGDSISQGLMGNTASFCYTAQLAKYFDAELLNQSVGGDCFDEGALDDSLSYQPTDVIVALGTNDAFFVRDYEKIVAAMVPYLAHVKKRYRNSRLFAVTPPYLMNAKEDGREQYALQCRVSEAIRREAGTLGYTVLCGEDAVPHDARFYSDIAHPNDLGFAQYALYMIRYLTE